MIFSGGFCSSIMHRMISPHLSVILLILSACHAVTSSDYCYFDSKVHYCEYGCCDTKCCSISTTAIIGMVLGGLFFLAMVVGCIVCLVCVVKNRSGNQGSVVQPVGNSNAVVVHNTPYGHQPAHPPPNYNQYNSYPPRANQSTSFNDPVYPPGLVNDNTPPAYSYNNPSKY